jgi:predicted acetyltransferase
MSVPTTRPVRHCRVTDSHRFVAVDTSRRAALENLWQLYKHDLSEFRDSHPNDEGLFVTRRSLDVLLADGEHEALLVYANERLAGFAIVGSRDDGPRDVSEFFIVRSQRRQHLGTQAAESLLRGRPGEWEVAFQEANPAAAAFWRRVARAVALGEVRETRRPVPERPMIPPDVWLNFRT